MDEAKRQRAAQQHKQPTTTQHLVFAQEMLQHSSWAGPHKIPGSNQLLEDLNLSLSPWTILKRLGSVHCGSERSHPHHCVCPLPKATLLVALTPTVIKCFERLVLSHIESSLRATLESNLFGWRDSRSTSVRLSMLHWLTVNVRWHMSECYS